jgi:NADH-quinone oxidoreductase subunit I
MALTASDVKWVEQPKLTLMEKLYVPNIVAGLGTTMKHMFKTMAGGGVTVSFPEQRPVMPPHFKGVHRLNRDEQGRVKCVACYLCSTACPAHCIDIVSAPSPWADREKYPETFVIDELRCIYCGMCEEACPVDAIELTTLFDLTGASRSEMMFDKESFSRCLIRQPQQELIPCERNEGNWDLIPNSTKASNIPTRTGPMHSKQVHDFSNLA